MNTKEQINEKEEYDTRTFPEIYKSLNQLQQTELRNEIISKTGVSRVTVFNWANKKRIPQYPVVRKAVSDCVKKVVGVRIPQHLLFDVKK